MLWLELMLNIPSHRNNLFLMGKYWNSLLHVQGIFRPTVECFKYLISKFCYMYNYCTTLDARHVPFYRELLRWEAPSFAVTPTQYHCGPPKCCGWYMNIVLLMLRGENIGSEKLIVAGAQNPGLPAWAAWDCWFFISLYFHLQSLKRWDDLLP